MNNIIKNKQKGYVMLIVTFLVLLIMLTIAMTVCFSVTNSQKKTTNTVKATQAYYAAEAGIEDALLRLKKEPTLSSFTYQFNVDTIKVNVGIPQTFGISKNIVSTADNKNIIKNIQTVVSLNNALQASFYYGIEVGEGGLIMGNGGVVKGNVFSAGNVSGKGTINNNLVVSGNGHWVKDVRVKGNVLAYSCLSGAVVEGDLTYVTGGQRTCTVYGSIKKQDEEISGRPLPIPQWQIEKWKKEAGDVEVITGDVTITNNQIRSMGPVKITGNLNISNGATLKMTGVIYVQGDIYVSNNAIVRLDSSYNSFGGILLSDGIISINNNAQFYGSGQAGSYVLVLSTSNSDSAVVISNNTTGAVFYASAGGLYINNGVSLMEATGYKVRMDNNSSIEYSSGLVHIYFTSGPGGGWTISDWQEY